MVVGRPEGSRAHSLHVHGSSPPAVQVNACGARHTNIAHGLYPRENVAAEDLARLVNWLNQHINTGGGRTYAGGLTKFEPKEIERLRIPRLDQIVL